MGVTANVRHDSFPKQGTYLGRAVAVCDIQQVIVGGTDGYTAALRKLSTRRQRTLCQRTGHVRPLILTWLMRKPDEPAWQQCRRDFCRRCGGSITPEGT